MTRWLVHSILISDKCVVTFGENSENGSKISSEVRRFYFHRVHIGLLKRVGISKSLHLISSIIFYLVKYLQLKTLLTCQSQIVTVCIQTFFTCKFMKNPPKNTKYVAMNTPTTREMTLVVLFWDHDWPLAVI